MYHTRFVVKVSITDIGQLASHVTRVIQACGEAPTSVNVIVDEPAAEWLQMTEYYRWVFANEPEWAPYRDLVLGSSR
jgi:hypothetical protein